MQMLVYQSLDLIEGQYARLKTKGQHESMAKLYNESTYLGMIFESNIGEYEMDVYAYLSNTRYKYIVIKND